MTASVTPAELHERFAERLGLEWVCGRGQARHREIKPTGFKTRPSLVGFLNLIHSTRIQVIGREEYDWLEGLDSRIRWESLAKVMDARPAAIIVANGLEVADDLEQLARESNTPLMRTPQRDWELIEFLEYQISRRLAQRTTLHGVFMEVFTIGVLITGEAGTGKSELALELISRGHRLIADDAPEFTQLTPDIIEGSCPPVLRECLEVRGLGILNIRRMFGDAALKAKKYLRLIIHLHLPEPGDEEGDRLHGDDSQREVLDLKIPQINLPVLAGRNMAVITEAAVRDFMLRMKGFDAAAEFVERHGRLLSDQT
ncbi:HPr(Ser) kinase/phosphatase [Wenzhouxiangella sp. AB-CW3]|uniref:HPr(Ser) kinase/phosphatase n=1 Tax=Wenzhouxiangella sp. AB-CW3 TaxID=2771012 RepID=UPI00168B9F87|nr:HPr(Ser) kinase/phosphatase [Wenzhouxiangella sp. AB-CW3]QOC21886.1 HPr(Ser) kinase/phosphatase [Wenzhouxiangella sp. AB-CW3]